MNSTVDDVQATDEPNGGATVRKLSEMHGGVTMGLLSIVLIVLSTTVAFGVAEVYFRVFNPQSIVPRYVEVSEFGIRKNIDHVQGVMSTAEFRHGFTTNSQRFRGQAEYAPVKPPVVYRIIVLADSVTLGHGVEDDETFPAVAQRELGHVRPVEVINMGVSGFGTAEELIQLEQLGLSYQPDLVVLDYFPNDPYNNVVSKIFSVADGRLVRNSEEFVPALLVRDRLSAIPGYSFLCQHSHVVNFVRSQASAFFIEYLACKNRGNSDIYPILSPSEREVTELLVRAVHRTTAERGIPLVVLNIPVILKGQVIQNVLKDTIGPKDSSVLVLDVQKTVYDGHPLSELSYAEDSHPKPLAHRLIGEALARVIQTKLWHPAKTG